MTIEINRSEGKKFNTHADDVFPGYAYEDREGNIWVGVNHEDCYAFSLSGDMFLVKGEDDQYPLRSISIIVTVEQ